MATKKDLVEAHSFSRRRLVTAFLSGAPGGREVEPSRPGRVIVGGIALSILLVAGAAIASVLAARTPADWQKPGIVVNQGTGTTYVILDPKDPVLHPILNNTSAQLIFGADAARTTVAQDTIDKETPGSTLGIFNAPADLPTTDRMIDSGWTACTGKNLGIRLAVNSVSSTQSGTGLGVTVRVVSDPDNAALDTYYVIAVGADDGGTPRARYFEVPNADASDTLLDDIGAAPRAEALTVPVAWVRLFEAGGPLELGSFRFDPTGPVPALAKKIPGAVVGSYVETEGGGGQVLTSQGVLSLSPFALAVYRRTTLPDGGAPIGLEGASFAGIPFTQFTVDSANWPEQTFRGTGQVSQVCAVLTAAKGEMPGVRLGVEPEPVASAASLGPDELTVGVEPGHGAFVYVGGFGESTGGDPVVINSQGNAYPILDDKSVTQLGYDSVPAPVVPDPWTKLFQDGVDLSTGQALCPPVTPPKPGQAAPVDPPDQVCLGPNDSPSASASPGTGADG